MNRAFSIGVRKNKYLIKRHSSMNNFIGIRIGIGGSTWDGTAFTPTYLHSEIISDTRIDLYWTGTANSYRIYISTDGINYSEKGTSTINEYSATGLSGNTIYYFYVVAYRGSQESPRSNINYTVTPPTAMYDGQTTGWWDFNEERTMTFINDLVSQLNSKVGTGNNLEQTVEGSRPAKFNEGLNLSDKLLQKTFTYRQPMYVYTIVAQITNNNGEFILKGNGTRAGIRGYNITGGLVLYSPDLGNIVDSQNADLVLYEVGIIRAFYDGANSFLQIDAGVQETCVFDATYYDGAYVARTITKEIIFRKTIVADFYDYLVKKKISVNNKYTFNRGKLIISFDNIDWSANPVLDAGTYTNGFNILKAKGVKGTFFVVPTWVDLETVYGTWEKAVEMYGDGMDLQCHSNTHPDLRTLSEAQLDAEMLAVNNAFTAHGLSVPRFHAYPSGLYNANVISYISDWRESCRRVEYDILYQCRALNFKNTNKYEAIGINIDYWNDATKEAATLAALDQASKVGGALFVYAHGCRTTSGITPTQLEDLIDTALGLGMDIITYSEFFDLLA